MKIRYADRDIYPSSIHLHLHRKYNKVSNLKIAGGQESGHKYLCQIHLPLTDGPSAKCVIKNTFLFFI